MEKIIQIATSINESEKNLYGLGEHGSVYYWGKRQIDGEYISGWILMEDKINKK